MLSSLLTDGIWGLEKSMLPPESSHLINCVLSNSKNTAFSCVVFQCQGRPFVACGCGNQGRVMSSALDNPLELLFHQPKHWPQKYLSTFVAGHKALEAHSKLHIFKSRIFFTTSLCSMVFSFGCVP